MRVLMFGALADAARRSDDFDLGSVATAQDVVDAVRSRYPDASAILDHCSVAVNQTVVPIVHRVGAADEVALLPPMSGGSVCVRLTESPSLASALEAVASVTAGGTAVFVGTVRDSAGAGRVEALEYSAYVEMAEKVMSQIAHEAVEKWQLCGVAIEHAIGVREAGEVTFVVACAAPHRDEAFDACRYVVDEVKSRTPIWKKERGPWGEKWIGL